MNKKIGIYKITSPSGKIYIGQSKNIPKRFKAYSQDWFLQSKKQPILINSLNKYGVENHLFEILENCELNLLNDKERFYQEKYNVIENGLNCVLVNSSNKPRIKSEATRKKISIAKKGKVVPKEVREKISKTLTGRKQSKETIEKKSKSLKGTKHTVDFKRDISERMKGLGNHQSKLVLNLLTGIFYDSISEAAFYHGLNPKALSHILIARNKKNEYSLMKLSPSN